MQEAVRYSSKHAKPRGGRQSCCVLTECCIQLRTREATQHQARVLAGHPCVHRRSTWFSTQYSSMHAGCLQVLDLSGGTMRLAASMQIPSLQGASAEALSSPQVLPVLQLWHDGQRAAVGNARHQAVWIVDLTGGKPSLELSGRPTRLLGWQCHITGSTHSHHAPHKCVCWQEWHASMTWQLYEPLSK